jgi:hypothetical protein
VNVELRVDIGRVQDCDVLGATVANGAALADLRRRLKRTRQNGSSAQADDDSDPSNEFPPRTGGARFAPRP